MKHWLSVVLLALLQYLPPACAETDISRTALVIGNSIYVAAGALKNPVNDAELIAKQLRVLKFDVAILLNANSEQFDNAVAAFSKTLSSKGGLGFVFYAGHAVQINGKNYLQPVDARFSTEAEVLRQGYDIDRIIGLSKVPAAQAVIMVFDACRNNPFDLAYRSSTGLAPRKEPGFLIAYSTAPYAKARDGSGRNSPYTQALAQALAKPQASIEAMFKATADAVYQTTGGEQAPWFQSSLRTDWALANNAIVERTLSDRIAMASEKNSSLRRDGAYQPGNQRKGKFAHLNANDWDEISSRIMSTAGRMSSDEIAPLQAKAQRGDAEAQTLFGHLYKEGLHVNRSNPKAMEWYRRASGQGFSLAQAWLGEMQFNRGQRAEGFTLLSLAAESGVRSAQADLAFAYAIGAGTTQNMEQAGANLLHFMKPALPAPK